MNVAMKVISIKKKEKRKRKQEKLKMRNIPRRKRLIATNGSNREHHRLPTGFRDSKLAPTKGRRDVDVSRNKPAGGCGGQHQWRGQHAEREKEEKKNERRESARHGERRDAIRRLFGAPVAILAFVFMRKMTDRQKR